MLTEYDFRNHVILDHFVRGEGRNRVESVLFGLPDRDLHLRVHIVRAFDYLTITGDLYCATYALWREGWIQQHRNKTAEFLKEKLHSGKGRGYPKDWLHNHALALRMVARALDERDKAAAVPAPQPRERTAAERLLDRAADCYEAWNAALDGCGEIRREAINEFRHLMRCVGVADDKAPYYGILQKLLLAGEKVYGGEQ